MDLRLVSDLAHPSSSLKLDIKSDTKKVMKNSNFCSIDKLIGNAEGGGNGSPKSNGETFIPFSDTGKSSPAVGVRMPSVLELVNGLSQHKAAAAAALRGELHKS